MASKEKHDLVWVRIPGTYNGQEVDRGQLIQDPPGAKSEQLKRLDYLVRYESERDPFICVECGAEFTEDTWRVGHYERRHREKVQALPPRMSDETDVDYSERVMEWKEQQENIELRRLEREIAKMPPNLEKTAASIRG